MLKHELFVTFKNLRLIFIVCQTMSKLSVKYFTDSVAKAFLHFTLKNWKLPINFRFIRVITSSQNPLFGHWDDDEIFNCKRLRKVASKLRSEIISDYIFIMD